VWKNGRFPGKEAGYIATLQSGLRYRVINFSPAQGPLLFHRLVWKLMTGEEPPKTIDHHDRDTLNNRWDNLRELTHGENLRNTGLWRNNTSGFKNVYLDKRRNHWFAQVRYNGRYMRLGRFATPEDAHQRVLEFCRGEYRIGH